MKQIKTVVVLTCIDRGTLNGAKLQPHGQLDGESALQTDPNDGDSLCQNEGYILGTRKMSILDDNMMGRRWG